MAGGTARLGMPRVCPHCDDGRVGDERHPVFECPALEHVRAALQGEICADSRCSMRMRQTAQKADASCLLQLSSEYAGLGDALLT